MSYLLDTCVLSQLRKEVPEKVQEWFSLRDSDLFFLSAVTLGELWDGIERLPKSKKRSDLEEWLLGEVVSRFKGRILSVDERVAREWGLMSAAVKKRGIGVGTQDLYIAATAKAHGLEIVTLNIKDFAQLDLPLVNPWQ